jgi:hypothetical protein
MSILTVEAIRKNPWSAVEDELPRNPSRLLLRAALFAVAYCFRSESNLASEAFRRDARRHQLWVNDELRDIAREYETRRDKADLRMDELFDLYESEFNDELYQ